MINSRRNLCNFFSISIFVGVLLFSNEAAAQPASSISTVDYEYGYGPISSLNNEWILAGNFMGYGNPANLSDSGFHATFSMVMKNGSAPHLHQMYNATLSDVRMDGNNTIMQGAATITMKDGPVLDVPTTWTIYNNNSIAISMDPAKINNHFGDTPIYGLELNPEKEMKMMNAMMDDTKFMNKWIPMMMENLLKQSKLDGKNMSIMPMSDDPIRNESILLPENTSGIKN